MGESLIIRADASTQLGTGHMMRCLALAQAWKDAGGGVIFVTDCQSDSLLQRLREEGFDINLLARSYPEPDDWHYTKDILAAHPNDWVVLDGYHFDEAYQQRVKEAGHRLLVIDDMAHLEHYYADIVLNQNLRAEKFRYSCQPYTRLLLGTHYVLLRREFLAWRGWKRRIPEVAQRVLVMFGGADRENHTLKVIQALQEVDIPGLEAIIVVGPVSPHFNELERAVSQSHIPIRIVRNAQNVPELVAWADVAISAAGSTVWELAFMGLPSIITVWAENQRAIAEESYAAGIALNLGWCADVTSADVSRALAWLGRATEARLEMAQRGQQLVESGGGQRVVSTMVGGEV